MFKALKNFFSGKDDTKSAEKAAISAMESQVSRMLAESVTVTTRSVDPDEGVATPKGAEISYLDAQALKFWDRKKTDYKVPPYYSESAFGRNVGPALKRLLNGGYLSYSDIERNIELKTVPELKAILADRELKTSGKKAELVSRLTSTLSHWELRELFPVGVYEITEKGKNALKPYSIIEVNNNYSLGFSYYRLLNERGKNPDVSDEDLLVRLLSQEIQKCYVTGNQSRYQDIIAKSARLLYENDAIGQAMDCYILGFFLFAMQVKQSPQLNGGGQSYYLALQIEQCGKMENYTLEQVLERMQKTIERAKPFNLSNKSNIKFAVSLFRKSLSV